MTRYTKSWTLLGVLMCASSVEGLLDGPQHFPSFPGSHRALATPSPLSCVSAPALQRNPIDSALAFVAGFDLVSFTETIKDFAIGGVSGAIAQTIVFPIDLAKTKMQDEVVTAGSKALYTGVLPTIINVARQEGVLKLWRGVTPVLIGSMPECALEIGSNTLARNKLAARLSKKPEGGLSDGLPLWGEVACGGVAGLFQVIATCPMERVKILQQVLGEKAGSVGTIVSQLGVGGMYKGVKPCLLRDISFAGIYFGLYHQCRKMLMQVKQENLAKLPLDKRRGGDAELGPLDNLIAGLAAGVPASFITCPLDVIKTRMQSCGVVGSNGCRVGVDTLRGTAAELWAEGQMSAFFKGVGGRVGRVAPQMALCLVLYEAIKTLVDTPLVPSAQLKT